MGARKVSDNTDPTQALGRDKMQNVRASFSLSRILRSLYVMYSETMYRVSKKWTILQVC